jgi:hypothetical protein
MKLVFAVSTTLVDQMLIRGGTHWPASDPLVLANPTLFSEDVRYGLQFTVDPESNGETFEESRTKRAYVRHN